jgi:hypothetical protein
MTPVQVLDIRVEKEKDDVRWYRVVVALGDAIVSESVRIVLAPIRTFQRDDLARLIGTWPASFVVQLVDRLDRGEHLEIPIDVPASDPGGSG